MPKPSKRTAGTNPSAESAPLYSRGPFALSKRSDRPNYDITWYDPDKRRPLYKSTKTTDLKEAERALDNHYIAMTGGPCVCERCGQPLPKSNGLLLDIIRDYRLGKGDGQASGNAIRVRLEHFERYAREVLRRENVRTVEINELWIQRFRQWMTETGYLVGPEGAKRRKFHAAATIENCVVQLAAAIAFCGEKPAFTPLKLNELSRSPEYRAGVPELAAMFRYCVNPAGKSAKHKAQLRAQRKGLLAFLRLSVATWARPDAILDASTAPERKQWSSGARVFHLNPIGRRQTHKYRPSVPVPEIVGQWLDTVSGPVVPTLSKHTFPAMAKALGLPQNGESGSKLIRRSMATICRPMIGESNWVQGRQMLGHEKRTMSDVYAFRDPRNWGLALEATEGVCAEIEKLCPGAFVDHPTPEAPNVLPFRNAA
jgi:hypothetical protein